MPNTPQINEDYINWVVELKKLINSSQIKASLSVNREMLAMYWKIGESISQKVEVMKWGSGIVDVLSRDLKKLFPTQKGFSRTNLFYMKKWFEFYSTPEIEFEKVQQLVGQIPWGQNIVIMSRSKDIEEALFYLNKTLINNWSRTVLNHQIELDLYERQGKAITNFETTLVKPNSELAVEKPTIGLLLCKSKSKIVAEYALRGTTQPIGIAEYELSKAIPDDLKAQLPTVETIEEELEAIKRIIS